MGQEAPGPALTAEERAARLRQAFDEGRITRAQYRQNLRKIGVVSSYSEPASAPPAPVANPPPPSIAATDRLAKVRAAYAAGRIPWETYLENVRRLGGEAEDTTVAPPSARVHAPATTIPPPMEAPPERKRVRKVMVVLNDAPPAPEPPPVPTAPGMSAAAVPSEPLAAHAEPFAVASFPEAPPDAFLPLEFPLAPPAAESETASQIADAPVPEVSASVSALALPVPEPVHALAVSPPMPIAEPGASVPPIEPAPEALAPEESEPVPEAPHVPPSVEALVTPIPDAVPREVANEEPPRVEEPIPPPTPAPMADVPAANPLPNGAVLPPDLPGRVDLIAGLYARGAISREAYERNARALGVEPEPPEPAVAARVPEGPQPASPEPARTESGPATAADLLVANPPARKGPPDLQARIDLIAGLYARHAISRTVCEKNVARVLEDVEPRLVALRRAFQEGQVALDAYRADVRKVLAEHGIP